MYTILERKSASTWASLYSTAVARPVSRVRDFVLEPASSYDTKFEARRIFQTQITANMALLWILGNLSH